MRNPANRLLASTAVVSIGKGCRGFVIELPEQRHDSVRVAPERLIITAAHCLELGEVPGPLSWDDERNWTLKLLAPLGEEPTIRVTCRFMDPVADIAVLGSPDDQVLAEAYNDLTKAAHALPIGILKPKFAAEVDAWLMSLDGRWFQCKTNCKTNYRSHDVLWTKSKQPIQRGMSGSPIIAGNGAAIGVVSCSIKTEGGPKETEDGAHPQLCAHLPAWLVQRAYTKTTASRLTAEGKRGLRGLRD
jgi:hypothetical protein